MTQGEDPYPPDEFDAVDPSAGPRGVHRRPRSRWATMWPYGVALLVAAGLAYLVTGLVWDDRRAEPAAVSSALPTAPPTALPTGDATEGTTADPATPSSAARTTVPAPDLTTPVTVLNSTSVVGLATEAAERLREAGWTEVATGNADGPALPSSTVRYASADLEGAARGVASELGITTVRLAGGGSAGSGAVDGIEVVLGLDSDD